MKLDLKNIKKLAKNIKDYNLSEINIESEGIKLTLKKDNKKEKISQIQSFKKEDGFVEEILEKNNYNEIKEIVVEGKEIISPMVGTFYTAPSPDSDDFVKIGDKIEVGETVCIVEAMKMMNEVKSTVSGEVISIKAENGKVVKKGEVLFLIR